MRGRDTKASQICAEPNKSSVKLTVVMARVSQVPGERLNGALAVDSGLGAEADERNHGQASVLNLVQLGALALHVERVEREHREEAGLRADTKRQENQHWC